jgi:hypothetical protein
MTIVNTHKPYILCASYIAFLLMRYILSDCNLLTHYLNLFTKTLLGYDEAPPS